MWLKLLQRQSIQEMIKPQFVNGSWRRPLIQGKQKAELKGYFEKTGVPWIYEKETPDVHLSSTYNRKPKKPKIDANEEVRIANIRKALSTQDERLEKLRLERQQAKPWVGHDKVLVGVLKALQAGETEAKKTTAKQSAASQKAAEIADMKELGIDGITRKQGSKSGMTSKGGSIGKKEREVLNLAKGNIGFETGGTAGATTEKETGKGGK